jgi:peptide/nickel transport system permease protein
LEIKNIIYVIIISWFYIGKWTSLDYWAQVLTVRNLKYIQAAKAIEAGNLRIMFFHVLPNIIGPLLVQMTLTMAFAIIAETCLSYLVLGASPEVPSWESMLRVA